MKTVKSRVLAVAVALLLPHFQEGFVACASAASATNISLLDSLAGAELRQSKEETRKLWDELLAATETGDFVAAKSNASTFLALADYRHPQQEAFANYIVGLTDFSKEAPEELRSLRAQITATQQEMAQVNQKLKDADDWLKNALNNTIGSILTVNKKRVFEDQRDTARRRKAELEADEARYKRQIQEAEAANVQRIRGFKDRYLTLCRQLESYGLYRWEAAMAQAYPRKMGDDAEFTQIAAKAVERMKVQLEAKNWLTESLVRVGFVQAEQARDWWKLRNLLSDIGDDIQLKLTGGVADASRAMVTTMTERVDREMKRAEAQLQDIDGHIERDADKAEEMLVDLKKTYPGFPAAPLAKTEAAIKDQRVKQIEARWKTRLEMARKTLEQDITEGIKAMNELVKEAKDELEASYLRSIAKQAIDSRIEREVGDIKSDLRDSFTLLNRDFKSAEEKWKVGEAVVFSTVEIKTVGRENLTRARSTLVGSLTRVKALSALDMDDQRKAQLAGVRATCDSAVATIDQSLAAKASGNLPILLGGVAGGVVLLGAVVFLLKRRPARPAA